MALQSGRVGVRNDQVDVHGRILGEGSSSNIEIRVSDEGKPQWREKGTEEWQNFSGGNIPEIDAGFDSGYNMLLFIRPATANGVLPTTLTTRKFVEGEWQIINTITNTDGISAVRVLNCSISSSDRTRLRMTHLSSGTVYWSLMNGYKVSIDSSDDFYIQTSDLYGDAVGIINNYRA